MENNKNQNITSKQQNGLTVGIQQKNKPKRYQVTEINLKRFSKKVFWLS